MNSSIRLFTFLKRQKLHREQKKGLFINIILCTMQVVAPILALFALMIVLGQEKKLSDIIKSYVTIGFILNIDNMFTGNFPQEVKQNAEKVNDSKVLKMGTDYNTFSKVYKRFKRSKTSRDYFNVFLSIIINIQFLIVSNFTIIIYNYFAPMICILIQLLGYTKQIGKEE